MTAPRSSPFLHSSMQPVAAAETLPILTIATNNLRTRLNFGAPTFFPTSPSLSPDISGFLKPTPLPPTSEAECANSISIVSTMPLVLAVPELSHLDVREELNFHQLSSIEFADSRKKRDLNDEIVWHAEAVEHVYSIEQFDQLAQTDTQYAHVELLRFVLDVDMQILTAFEGLPRENIPSHAQMTKGNAFSIASGLLYRKMVGDVLWIEGADNMAGGFKGSFQNLQFLFIQLLDTRAYSEGKICLAEELIFKDMTNPQHVKTYFCSKDKFIMMILELKKIYQDNLLSADNLAAYSRKIQRVDYPVVPKNMSAKEYKLKRSLESLTAGSLERSVSQPQLLLSTPVKRKPDETFLSRSAEKAHASPSAKNLFWKPGAPLFAFNTPTNSPVRAADHEEKSESSLQRKPPKMQKRL